VSVSIDLGGDDVYGNEWYQGVASPGINLLFELGGNDRYEGYRAAGYGGTGGVGAVFEFEGDDVYDSSTGQGKGGDSLPGMGILLDFQGNDLYMADAFGQGEAGSGGLGALVDFEGSDVYQGRTFVQGVGFNQGTGILIDLLGDDSYAVTEGVGQGAVNRVGTGVLLDQAGNDGFWAPGNDVRGFIQPLGVPYNTGVALFHDRAGADTYVGYGANGLQADRGTVARFMDTNQPDF
jgi:hypothetical protein